VINEILRNNLIIREWVNGGLVPLNLSLVFVIGLFLWDSAREADSYKSFSKTSGVPTACSLFWIFAADAMRACSAWYILWKVNDRVPPPISGIENLWVSGGFIIAGVVALIASVRCIYLFTPPWLGHYYWIGSLLVTLAFQFFT